MNAQIPRVVHRDGDLRLVLAENGAGAVLLCEELRADALGGRGWSSAPVERSRAMLERYAARLLVDAAAELEGDPVQVLELLENVGATVRGQALEARRDARADAGDLDQAADLLGRARALYRAAGMRRGWL